MSLTRPRLNSGAGRRGSPVVIAQYLFLVVGLLALGYCAYVLAEAHVYQAYESWRLDQMRRHAPASATDFAKTELASLWSKVTGRPAPWASGEGERRPLRGAPSEGSLLGLIAVPRIGLYSVVREGDDDKALELAAGHIPGTALPGQAGNVAIAGHRDTFFRGLRNVRKDDEITFKTPDETYRYRVESTQVVAPDDTAVLKAGGEPSLTLVTCYPFNYVGSAPDRFIVHARQVTPVRPTSHPGAAIAFAAPRLPSALPGESTTVASSSPSSLHRRRVIRRTKSAASRAPSDTTHETDDDADSSHVRQKKARELASRLRTEWSRLIARLKGNERENDWR